MALAGDWLERIRIDWTDFAEASRVSLDIVQCLAEDRSLLRRMLLDVEQDEVLRALAEKHGEISYVVLHDALDRGIRVRLHQFHTGQEDLPHSHRYSFSSALLSGAYVHTLYEVRGDTGGSAPRRPAAGADLVRPAVWALEQPEGTSDGADLPDLAVVGHERLLRTVQSAGSAYSLHHSAIHNVAMPHGGAFSVFCRGPAEQRCAIELDPAGRTYRWKFGRQHESSDVLARRRMTRDDFRTFVDTLEECEVISA